MHPFRKAVESRDLDALRALFAEDVVFRSPVVFEPLLSCFLTCRRRSLATENITWTARSSSGLPWWTSSVPSVRLSRTASVAYTAKAASTSAVLLMRSASATKRAGSTGADRNLRGAGAGQMRSPVCWCSLSLLWVVMVSGGNRFGATLDGRRAVMAGPFGAC